MAISYGTDWVNICNKALGRLAAGAIADLEEGSQLANYCALYLGEAIENILGEYDWRNPRKRIQIAPIADTPVYGYDYAYELPVDFIRLIEVSNDDEGYSVEGNTILTDAAEVYITYVYRPDDPAKLSGPLKNAISTELAYLLTTPLTSTDSLANRIAAERSSYIISARAADARNNKESTGAEDRGYEYYEDLR